MTAVNWYGDSIANSHPLAQKETKQEKINMLEVYSNDLKRLIAFNGFTSCCLSNNMIKTCYQKKVTIDQAYNIQCDMNAGYSFKDSLESNT